MSRNQRKGDFYGTFKLCVILKLNSTLQNKKINYL